MFIKLAIPVILSKITLSQIMDDNSIGGTSDIFLALHSQKPGIKLILYPQLKNRIMQAKFGQKSLHGDAKNIKGRVPRTLPCFCGSFLFQA
jgi:hypothetical protein